MNNVHEKFLDEPVIAKQLTGNTPDFSPQKKTSYPDIAYQITGK